MYEEGKLLKVERPDEAQLNGGLTAAEANQLTIDSCANPVAFSELQVICGLQYEDREVLKDGLENLQAQQTILEGGKGDYKKIWQMLSGEDTTQLHEGRFVLSAAHTGAARAVREMKAEVQKQSDGFFESAAAYSAEMVTLCRDRLGGAPLIILGRLFDYSGNYLSTDISDKHSRMTVLFGPLGELGPKQRTMQQREPNIHTRSKIKAVGARLEDWDHLLQALQLVNIF